MSPSPNTSQGDGTHRGSAQIQPPGQPPRPIARRWRWLPIALGPALLLIIELLAARTGGNAGGWPSREALSVLGVTAWMGLWWVTEAVPIAVTSLVPLLLFPLLGVATPAETSLAYGNHVIFLVLGGLLLARAMEATGLHKRMALGIVRLFGRTRRGLVLGFMIATAFISMWISNTATAVMILPVALAVLRTEGGLEHRSSGATVPLVEDLRDEPFTVALLLGVAFGANIGGFGTPIGSPPTVVFQSIYAQKTGSTVAFGEWMLYGVPVIALVLPITWWLLVRRLAPGVVSKGAMDRPTTGGSFGPMSWNERSVAVAFACAASLWMTRTKLGPIGGWGPWLAERGVHVEDSTIAIAVVIALFAVSALSPAPFLSWSRASARLPWGVLLLLGAGFALSSAFDSSGLTHWIGGAVVGVSKLPFSPSYLFLAVLFVVVMTSIIVTEFASNTASASILLPVVFGASVALGEERFPPDLLMIACALGCTAGFAVPAGTPPNALAFSTGRISVRRFAANGVVVDGAALIVITALIWGVFLVR